LEAASEAGRERARRLSTAVLNQVVTEALTLKQPTTGRGGKKGRVYYCTQVFPPRQVIVLLGDSLIDVVDASCRQRLPDANCYPDVLNSRFCVYLMALS
jgi:predicted GTPase